MAKPTTENRDNTQEEIDVEKAVEAHNEIIEDLSDVDIGLGDEAELLIAVQQRFQHAIAYKRMEIQATNARLSVSANEAAGNPKGSKEFETRLETLELELKHQLRSIKEIDRKFPKAKEKMKDLVNSENKKTVEGLFSQ